MALIRALTPFFVRVTIAGIEGSDDINERIDGLRNEIGALGDDIRGLPR